MDLVKMKATSVTLAVTLALSFVLWLAYYASSGGAVPTKGETTVLVGMSLAAFLVTRALWRRLRRPQSATQEKSDVDGAEG